MATGESVSGAPVRGPLGFLTVDLAAIRGDARTRLLYLDADLVDRDGLRRALGLPAGPHDDATLILRAYERWGLDTADRLCGAFAFLLWDAPHRRLVGARDPIGLAPFGYATLPGRFAVSGDIRALLRVEGVSEALDDEVFVSTLLSPRFQPVSFGRTCLRDVRTVPPGHTVQVEGGTVRVARYWHPEHAPPVRYATTEAYVEAFRDRLNTVLTEYVPEAEPLGVHVTGGLDSSACVAVASRVCAARGAPPPVGFSWLAPPDETPSDEHERTRLAAAHGGLPLVYAPITEDGMRAFLAQDATRDPYTSTLMHEGEVQRAAAARGVRVILSGWGGDQGISFSGHMTAERYLARRGRLWSVYRTASARGRSGWRLLAASLLERDRFLKRTLAARRRDALRGDYETYVARDRLQQASLLEPPHSAFADPLARLGDMLGSGHLAERAVAWAVAGAERGLRYRYPLLDRRLLAFVLGMPPDRFLPQDGERRWLMRRALAGDAPRRIRVHTSKKEPARLEAAHAVMAAGLRQVGAVLHAQAEPPARADWFAYDRLLEALDAAQRASSKPSFKLVHALVHLGWARGQVNERR